MISLLLKFISTGLLSFCLIYSSPLFGQKEDTQSRTLYRIAFYNAENYFDPFVDSTTNYNEFTPEGDRHWTFARFGTKRDHIYKVLAALGGWNWPSIVGFAEIENRFVLEDLLKNTPLNEAGYKILHYESIDHRGIDVGMIYQSKDLEIIYSRPVHLYDQAGKRMATRDILYAKVLIGGDTLHLFINHWPSRYGGMLQSEPLRAIAAKTLVHLTDSLCKADEHCNILIMGDFNDDPDDKSIQILTDVNKSCRLFDLDELPDGYHVKGTLKYKSDWNRFDQVIVSSALFKSYNDLAIEGSTAHIFSPPFLLEDDDRYLDKKPRRTYNGFVYQGGFSDHLPVYLDLYTVKNNQ